MSLLHYSALAHIITKRSYCSQRYVCTECRSVVSYGFAQTQVLCCICRCRLSNISEGENESLWNVNGFLWVWSSFLPLNFSEAQMCRAGGAAMWWLILRVSFGSLGKMTMWIKGTCLVQMKPLLMSTIIPIFGEC